MTTTYFRDTVAVGTTSTVMATIDVRDSRLVALAVNLGDNGKRDYTDAQIRVAIDAEMRSRFGK